MAFSRLADFVESEVPSTFLYERQEFRPQKGAPRDVEWRIPAVRQTKRVYSLHGHGSLALYVSSEHLDVPDPEYFVTEIGFQLDGAPVLEKPGRPFRIEGGLPVPYLQVVNPILQRVRFQLGLSDRTPRIRDPSSADY